MQGTVIPFPRNSRPVGKNREHAVRALLHWQALTLDFDFKCAVSHLHMPRASSVGNFPAQTQSERYEAKSIGRSKALPLPSMKLSRAFAAVARAMSDKLKL
jgi:hypothetical protein